MAEGSSLLDAVGFEGMSVVLNGPILTVYWGYWFRIGRSAASLVIRRYSNGYISGADAYNRYRAYLPKGK